ncbi:MAG: hypothetical protein Q9228_002963 [Teloschistes exilis]
MYGFYVNMGGLAVNIGDIHDRWSKVLLTSSGVTYLAQKGYFFEIADSDLRDKSKADSLAKILVLLQITWTILQCLCRTIAGLPLSVLEVHVLVHAGCALIMYMLWFSKPLRVDEPTDVTSRIPDKLIALMLVRNHRFGTEPLGNFTQSVPFHAVRTDTGHTWPSRLAAEAELLMYNPYHHSQSASTTRSSGSSLEQATSVEHLSNSSITQLRQVYENTTGETQPCQGFRVSRERSCWCQSCAKPSASCTCAIVTSSLPGTYRTEPQSPSRPSTEYECRVTPLPPALDRTPLWTKLRPREYEHGRLCNYFHIQPPDGVKTVATISTGAFVESGIGPRIYTVGSWHGHLLLPSQGRYERPGAILEIANHLRRKLPLTGIDLSTVAYYCPLHVSLSQKDLLRWQLAGAALADELRSRSLPAGSRLPIRSSQGDPSLSNSHTSRGSQHRPHSDSSEALVSPHENTFLTFETRGGTFKDAYFVPSVPNQNIFLPFREQWVRTLWRVPRHSHREILLLRSYLHRLQGIEEMKMRSTTAVMMLPGLLYGGLHLTLWAHDFPTRVEGLLWRISAVALIAIPVATALPLIIYNTLSRSNRRRSDAEQSNNKNNPAKAETGDGFLGETITKSALSLPQRICVDLAVAIVLSVFLLYVFSRVFIIVESFISLRRVPVGVYKDVGWSKYVPHF